jgi:hypothetical protein
MKRTMTQALAGLSLVALCGLAACHIVVSEPDEGVRSWWYYCDEYGCYRCDSSGCLFPEYLCESGDCAVCRPEDEDCSPTTVLCDEMRHCSRGQICLDGVCGQKPAPCREPADCGDGAYCSNGACVPSGLCDRDADCRSVGADFGCDERGSCAPAPKGPTTCAEPTDCGDGGMCVDGLCGTCSGDCGGGDTCELDAHCGDGRACVDAQCVNHCDKDEQCGSNQRCNVELGLCLAAPQSCGADVQCAAGSVCVNGTCYADCTSDGACASAADVCSDPLTVGDTQARVCVADHSARPECALSKDCTDNEQCVNGVCRTVCAAEVDCASCDDGPVCGKGGFCMTADEATPQCKSSDDCDASQICRDSRCITP